MSSVLDPWGPQHIPTMEGADSPLQHACVCVECTCALSIKRVPDTSPREEPGLANYVPLGAGALCPLLSVHEP